LQTRIDTPCNSLGAEGHIGAALESLDTEEPSIKQELWEDIMRLASQFAALCSEGEQVKLFIKDSS
jgi:hypothetical protein